MWRLYENIQAAGLDSLILISEEELHQRLCHAAAIQMLKGEVRQPQLQEDYKVFQ